MTLICTDIFQPWQRGIMVIVYAYIKEDPWFEPRKGYTPVIHCSAVVYKMT
jgi:hypothetical protein